MPVSAAPAVLVTGGAQRIGHAIARRLAGRGWAVAIHCHHSRAQADTLAEELRTQGARVAVVTADLACETDVLGLVDQARAAVGPLTALVNNASVFVRDQWDTVTRDSWTANMDINLRAPFLLTQAFARQLPADAAGAVVNLVDQRVWRLNPDFTSYTVSKAGLWTLTQTLAQALAPHIRVNAVGPGPVLQSIHHTPDSFHREAANVPLRHAVPPEEIADAVLFLLDSPSITGQMIAVDSGQHLAWATPDIVGVY